MNGEEVIFYETYAAAQSLKNKWTKMASTIQSIQVILTGNYLTIKPRWLIRWLVFILGLDLNHTIPINRIKSAEEKGTWMNYGKIQITFTKEDGESRDILLYLKNHPEFISKLKQMIQ